MYSGVPRIGESKTSQVRYWTHHSLVFDQWPRQLIQAHRLWPFVDRRPKQLDQKRAEAFDYGPYT